ncbi:TPM domain-containing protein [Scytonema sp. UIC 10036]|uniref:TPM domain-containing protein n=1 Tax=Scytonema sp. UIC 10036 TaxID=2304196 RepID=UPI0012DA3C21|nr:TPM domain-containing protein [Scytonema sp. UIC 10036]MUG99587.1 TPM domain-containing protein [Scytonema sp. UIC 10036]
MKLNFLKPKRVFWVGLFSSAMFLFPLSSLALTVQEVPNPRQEYGGWVTDMAGILSNETETQINQMISQLEAKNGTEMAVVTVSETVPAASPKKFAIELFNYWGIGKKGQDNGVLFLISVGDRRVEIETGYGVEAILPDAKVGNIIKAQIISRFKKGDFEGGTLAGTKALVVILESEGTSSVNKVITPTQETSSNAQATSNSLVSWAVLVIGGISIVLIGGTVYLARPRKISIKPEGHTRISQGNYIFLCADCQQLMEKVDETTLASHLSNSEKTGQNLGSVRFEGWKCPNCSQKLTNSGYHIVAQESHSSRFRKCPHCQELTVRRTEKTITPATEYTSGCQLITDECLCCSYHHEQEKVIPRLPPSFSSSWGSDSSSSGGGGGSSFGGGSSGGGGAGGDW